MNTFLLTEENECNNCRRKIEAGETMFAESEAVLKNRGALCVTCHPFDEQEPEIKKSKKK